MIPKDKAIDLVNKIYNHNLESFVDENGLWEHRRIISYELAKDYALIAVDEIIYSQNTRCMECGGGDIDFWKKVKKEIEKL